MKNNLSFDKSSILELRRAFIILIIVLVNFNNGFSHVWNRTTDVSFSYNSCNGYAQISLLHFIAEGGTDDDDYIKYANFYLENGSDVYHFGSVGGSNNDCAPPVNIGLNYGGYQGNRSGDCNNRANINLYVPVPTAVLNSGSFRLRVTGEAADDANPDTKFNWLSDLIMVNAIPKPSTPLVTTNRCNDVRVSWQNGTVTACNKTTPTSLGTVNNLHILIYRGGSYIKSIPFGSDNEAKEDFDNLASTSPQNYSIRYRQYFNGGRYKDGELVTSTLSGNKKPLPVKTTLTVLPPRCDLSIGLSWGTSSGATGYRLYRVGIADPIYQGNALSYTDNQSLTRGTPYTYTLYADNICGATAADAKSGSIRPLPSAPVVTSAISEGTKSIRIRWNTTPNAEYYKVERTLAGGAGATLIDVPGGAVTTLLDTGVDYCENYEYRVIAYNACSSGGTRSSNFKQASATPSLSSAFSANALKSSKGVFTSHVELSWTLSGPNSNLVNTIKIYRRVLGLSDSTLIATLNSGSNLYTDFLAQGGVLYNYSIQAEAQCEGSTEKSNVVSAVGFRLKSGRVSGKVSYTGGNAVENVKVIGESASGVSGQSLKFEGGQLHITNQPNLNLTDELLVETWFEPSSYATDFDIIKKSGSYNLGFEQASGNYYLKVNYNVGSETIITVHKDSIPLNKWVHIAGQVRNDSMFIYINEKTVASSALLGKMTLDNTANPIVVGVGFTGYLKELRIWKVAKTNEIFQTDFNRFMNGNELGLIVYLPMNEGIGDFSYDRSQASVSLFNNNHAELIAPINWSSNVPDPLEELTYAGYTNASGDYTLTLPYYNEGEFYTLTPIFETHQFNPSSISKYVGDDASVINGVDFEDISSFPVSGTLFYDNTSCSVEGATISVDGQPVVQNGAIVKTDENGAFSIEVPIGEHSIEITKQGHEFSQGRFPLTGLYDFQSPITGLEFFDSTTLKVIGRVVGGQREAIKKPGFGKSKNNIGLGRLIFKSELGNGCHTDTALTSSANGEYSIDLLPLKYVQDVSVVSNPTIFRDPATGAKLVFDLLDLFNIPNQQVVYDSIPFTNKRDSIFYYKQLDHIHYTDPQLTVKDAGGVNDFIGDTLYRYVHPLKKDSADINLRTNPFRWPVIQQGPDKIYTCLIRVFERYENRDDINNIKVDSVPATEGELIFNNDLSLFNQDSIEIDMMTRDRLRRISLSDINTVDTLKTLIYKFKPGIPNLLSNASVPEYSFTRKFEINIIAKGKAIPWQPQPFGDKIFRAYLLGTQSTGEQYVTLGPQLPTYVLRDPPGSGSSASRELGSSQTKENSWSWDLGGSYSSQDGIYLGTKFTTGLGVSVASESKNNAIFGLKTEISGGNSGSHNETTESTFEWSTNSGSNQPGRGSDLYIGSSQNVQFGISESLVLMPDSLSTKVSKLGDIDNSFIMAKTFGLSIVPRGYATEFIYDENHIKNYLIPDIKNLRNKIIQTNPDYVCVVCDINDFRFGLNNDDPIFPNPSTATPRKEEEADVRGPSYIYSGGVKTDSVRLFNEQIWQWEDAIRKNEWEKKWISNPDTIRKYKEREIAKIEEEYKSIRQGYEAAAGIAIGAGAAGLASIVALQAAPIQFGGNFIVFGVTTAAGITFAELTEGYNKYQEVLNRAEAKFAELEARVSAPLNYSISGGSSFTSSITHSAATSSTSTINFQMGASLKQEIEFKVNNVGVGVERSLEMNFSSGRDWTNSSNSSESVSFTLFDPDQGDFFSVDVYPSLLGYGPIFKKRAGGQTSCPHEDEELTEYSLPLGEPLNGATRAIDAVSISVNKSIQTNIPADAPAVFNLSLGNESVVGLPRTYNVETVSTSNPFGAIVRIDGSSSISPTIPGLTQINKVLTVSKGAGPVYNYDSLLVIIYAPCQYAAGTSDNVDIVDSVYISAHFIPTCTNVSLAIPEDQWVANNSFQNTIPSTILNYDINIEGLNKLRLDYKPSEQTNWIGLKSFWKDTSGRNDATLSVIPTSTTFTQYDWEVGQLTDGGYDLRVVSECIDTSGVVIATNTSETHSGYIDRINPHAFGSPTPADGILDPDDDILLALNEVVEIGSITSLNFDVRGVLNGSLLRHETSLDFDGVGASAIIPEYQLQKRSMTIEFWLKRNSIGSEVILSQGNSSSDQLTISFNSANQLTFQLGHKELKSVKEIDDQKWHHYAIVYDRDRLDAEIYIDYVKDQSDLNFGVEYNSTGPINLGKHVAGGLPNMNASMHDLRFWSIPKTESTIAAQGLVSLSGREAGLIGYWALDEGHGVIAYEKVRSRHAQITNANWKILPQNHAFEFNGSTDYLEAKDANTLAFNRETDLTIEAWFKTGASSVQSILSNGKADGTTPEDFSWNIYLNASGSVIIENDGNEVVTPSGYNDTRWHHFSAVIERTKAVSIYMDGELVETGNAAIFNGFAGPKLWIGCRGWSQNSVEQRDSYFNGKVDEIRIWNTARKSDQISRDFVNQLNGDELGLIAYYAFDGVKLESGIYQRVANLEDAAQNSNTLTAGGSTSLNFKEDAPAVKLPRLTEKVNFTYSINEDQIFIEITDPPSRVENVILDITVGGIKDLAGNVMQSPETWIAYIDKNQVFWEEEYFQFEKDLEDNLSFTTNIKNTGGSQERFSLSNLPSWLTATPSSGLIDPNSRIEVEFRVQPLLNIGEYEQDIFVSTESFGFNERLLLDLKVTVDPPVWEVVEDAFDQSMNITGELFINDVISTDPEDVVSVWVNDELRGVSHVEFDPSSGKNLVFLTVLSNQSSGEVLEFRAWDASRGRLLKGLMPDDIDFIGGGVINSRTNPLPIKATVLTQLNYVLNKGWNWISFPLDAPSLADANVVLQELSPTESDQMKSQDQGAAQSFFYSGGSWSGNVAGVTTNLGYKIKVAKADTFRYQGTFVDPSTQPIDITSGWNWVGVKSEFIIDVPSAMASLDPQTGDIIKGQRSFAIFEDGFGWGGNLDFLQPQQGYMLQYHKTDQLTFPGNLNARAQRETQLKSRSPKGKEYARLEKNLGYSIGKYSNTMSLIAAVDDCIVLDTEGVLELSQWSLAAHAGDECRGVVESTWIGSIGEYRYYLSIEGNSAVPLTFKLVHNSNGQEIVLNQSIDFETNGVVGMNSAPYLFSCVVQDDCINTMMYQNADIDMSQTDITRQVLMDLQSNAVLPTGRVFRFKAGQSIEFMGEFEVTRGAILEAYIEDCIRGN